MRQLILIIASILFSLIGYAQGGYDPENPGDPNPYRKLIVLALPKAGGSASTYNGTQVGVGQTVSCSARENTYYDFVHWLKNGEIASTERNYSFTMPDEDVEMVAVFELNYNPQSPDDPQEVKPSHRVTLTASPGKGGRFNNSVFKLCEGDSTNIYAYPNEGYRFEEWLLDGVLVSVKNPLQIKITDKDLNYTARFSYNPVSPGDPSVNMFNNATGEMIIDKFVPGQLSSAISRLLGDSYEYSQIQSLIICGNMDASDFGFIYRLSDCSVIDLSRTNGYNEIPSYAFESATALTEISLPSCVSAIARYAFSECTNLSVITCHATVPPSTEYGTFNGIDKSVVIKVPSQSVDLYKNAQGWKDFTILPVDSDVYSLTVSLPKDASDGRYKNMSIELLNITNGQRYKYLITDKTDYVFNNLLSSTKYSVAVKNSKDEILGEITDLEITDKDIAVTFENLRQPQNINLTVLTPDGTDVTSEIDVKWFYEDNNLLGHGTSLNGVLENTILSYLVTLPQGMQSVYRQPEKQTHTVSAQNSLTIKLEEIGKFILSGNVCDADGKPISSAIVTVSQNINGTYSNSVTTQCDGEGKYTVEIPDVPCKITISANGYVSRNFERQPGSSITEKVSLDKITGFSIIPSYTFQSSIVPGSESETQSSDWFDDYANIAYRVEDTDGNEIPDCIYQSGSIILPSSITSGDMLNVIAYSKTNRFKDVKQLVKINSKTTPVTIPIVEYGGINVSAANKTTASNICLLYDNDGKQVRKGTFQANTVSFSNLPDGRYSIVSMRKSQLLGSVVNLSSLRQTQLEEERDYLLNSIDVVSGNICEISIAEIPALDETKLYYTNSDETYFMPNKSQLTIGNYLTLKAKITVKDEFADLIDAATLVVDIPSGCELVENSIISGSGYLGYELNGNRLSVPLQRLSDAVRFCIVPIEGGVCKPNAFVKLIVDNEEVLQPIGSAYFDAKNFSLAAPNRTSKTTIAVQGTATANSEVRIYDNENLVGSTYSMPNGQWSVNLNLHKPYTKSIHNLYGEIISKESKRLLTQSRTVDYDQSYVDLSKVTMVYNNNNIVFDHLNGKNTVNSYSYVPGKSDFTFIVDFTENNPEKISNVIIKVLASDGTIKVFPAEYNPVSKNWIVKTKYSDSNKLPVNATADFNLTIFTPNDDLERIEAENQFISNAIDDYVSTLMDRDIVVTDETSESYSLDLVNAYDNKFHLDIKKISISQTPSSDDALVVPIDNGEIYIHTSNSDGNDIIYIWNETLAYKISCREQLTETQNGMQKSARAWYNNWGDFGRGIVRGINSIPLLGNRDLVNACDDYNYWENRYFSFVNNHIGYNKLSVSLLLAKCDDGDYKLSNTALEWYEMYRGFYKDDCDRFELNMRNMLDRYKKSIWWRCGISAGLQVASFGAGKALGAFTKAGAALKEWINQTVGRQICDFVAGNAATSFVSGAVGDVTTDSWIGNYLANYCEDEERKIRENYIELNNNIKNSYRNCPEDDDDDDDDDNEEEGDGENFPTPPVTPSIDPSGYVYEAVPSNRIPGVTATAYYKQQTEDLYGDITETAVVWDAAPFGQENPLTTDAEGKYAWDVPAGMWQVRFEKEGYEAAHSEWLPVPPPQLDVNIAMTQAKQPEVKNVHAYSDGVTIEFDKFMLPSTMTLGNITVTQNGQLVDGEIIASDMELDANGNPFCSKIEYKPSVLLSEGEATVIVSKAVKSYANINMGEDFIQIFTVEPRLSEIKISQNIEVPCGSNISIPAALLPVTAACGKSVLIESLNPIIAEVSTKHVEADENGNISFDVSGYIIGNTDVKLTVEDYDITTLIHINVVAPQEDNQVAKPYASKESGDVEIGTEIFLFCDTENASIYYTLDGSCPCDVNRLKYDGTPIVVTQDITLKIMAEREGMGESEIAEYQYTVNTTEIGEIKIGKDLSIYPLPLGEYLNITNGDNSIDSVSIFDLNGKLMLHTNKSKKQVSLKVGFLTSGIYILNVKTNGQSFMKKIIKR